MAGCTGCGSGGGGRTSNEPGFLVDTYVTADNTSWDLVLPNNFSGIAIDDLFTYIYVMNYGPGPLWLLFQNSQAAVSGDPTTIRDAVYIPAGESYCADVSTLFPGTVGAAGVGVQSLALLSQIIPTAVSIQAYFYTV